MNFSKTIIKWYYTNKRELPFRNTKDPYKIWLSEIILQQTRVSQGLPYYEKFVKLFPTIHHLAKAKEDVIMKTWQGLGYYSRARNLHYTAKHISTNLNGIFPDVYEEIKKLKGIGDYTASAIASLAFNKPHAVVDGNVYRVLSRYCGIKTPIDNQLGKTEYRKIAEQLLDRNNPGDFNQAIMEFGALQCVPMNPNCYKCPLQGSCTAYAKKIVKDLPIKINKVKTKIRYFNYLVVDNNKKTLLKKRIEQDIWNGLYDFPLFETSQETKQLLVYMRRKKLIREMDGIKVIDQKTYKQVLSHQVIYAKFWKLNYINDATYISKNKIKTVLRSRIKTYAFPKLIQDYIDECLFDEPQF